MPDYTSVHFWINQLAGHEMANLGDSEINRNHMALAACGLYQAITLSPKGTPTEPMQRQVNRVANAFASVGTTPGTLHERLKRDVPKGTNQAPPGSAMIRFGPGVGGLSPRAYALAKPSEPEGAHFLAAVLEDPTPELRAALKAFDISTERLIEALLTAPDTPPKRVESQKTPKKLPVLAQSVSRRSVVTISGAKWKQVSVNGWRFELNQNEALALCLTPSRNANGPQLSNFENPVEEGGGLDLVIHFDEPVEISGDATTLIVASRNSGLSCSLLIECVPNSMPAISKSFKVAPSGDSVRRLRLRLDDEPDAPTGLRKLLSFVRVSVKTGKEMSVNDGDTLPVPARARLTALDDADIGISITAVAGEKNIGAVISCDSTAKLWSYAGKGHPSLGVLIWVELPAGKSLHLSKSSLAVIAHPSQRSSRHIAISLTDSVEAGFAG